MPFDFVETDWFKKLWPLIMARYNLKEDQAKVLTVTLALGKRVSVNEIKEILQYFKGSCDRSRADTVAESLRNKGLLTKNSNSSRKLYKAIPYEDIWPEIEETYFFLVDCKTIIEQNQETINFEKEIEQEDMNTFEREHDIISYMRELCSSRISFVVLRDKEAKLWNKVDKRLKDIIEEKKLRYIPSKVNAIILLKEKNPIGFIRLKRILQQQGSPLFQGTKILDPGLATIIYKKEVLRK